MKLENRAEEKCVVVEDGNYHIRIYEDENAKVSVLMTNKQDGSQQACTLGEAGLTYTDL